MLGFMAVACVPAMMVARSLVQVFDAFRIRQEMERAIGICMIFACECVIGRERTLALCSYDIIRFRTNGTNYCKIAVLWV